MPAALVISLLFLASYLIGAIPFGYLIGRLRGVDLFTEGSGNIGATNAARVLGAKYGALVFALDFLKGVVPCAAIVSLTQAMIPDGESVSHVPLKVGAAALAFLGHLFPVYLGFQGGKGVATGAGTIFVLVPVAAALAILSWVVVLFASRMVSLASLVAVTVLVAAHLIGDPQPFSELILPTTLYLFAGAAMVVVKHRANIKRLLGGTESRIRDFSARQSVLRAIHLLALGFWFGGIGFFNFFTAPTIFATFKQVVYAGPTDRTAYETIIPADVSSERKDALASALAGSAVGPVFPLSFGMQAFCGLLALTTALSWWRESGRVHRLRVVVIALAAITICVGWPLSTHVTELRLLRFSPDHELAQRAKADFVSWHLASLFLSFVTLCLTGVAMALAALLPMAATVNDPNKSGEKT